MDSCLWSYVSPTPTAPEAMADPGTSPVKLQKLRERAARPKHELLRYLAESKVAKVQTQEDRCFGSGEFFGGFWVFFGGFWWFFGGVLGVFGCFWVFFGGFWWLLVVFWVFFGCFLYFLVFFGGFLVGFWN